MYNTWQSVINGIKKTIKEFFEWLVQHSIVKTCNTIHYTHKYLMNPESVFVFRELSLEPHYFCAPSGALLFIYLCMYVCMYVFIYFQSEGGDAVTLFCLK